MAQTVQNHADLADLIAAWPDLPDAVRTGIVAMVKGVQQ